jgi:hypothetical protein
MTRISTVLASALLASILASAARAETIVLDGSTGAAYDSVGDGWFFGTFDGVGDAGGNPLAVGYITGALELRALSEFPLAPLDGLGSADIATAILTVTIDDVIPTFGPGATFDGTASDPIVVYHYPADGTVAVADFNPAGLAQIGFLNPGAVTDTSLVDTGPVVLTIDATAMLKAALDGGDTAFGVLMGTADSPTATSLDDLSPPGVAGGQLPFLTIETVEPAEPPVLGAAAQSCQGSIAKAGTKLVSSELKAFSSCFGLALKDVEKTGTVSEKTISTCAAQLDTSVPTSKLGKALATFDTKVAKRCTGLAPADLGSPCDAGAEGIETTLTCVKNANLAAGQELVDTTYTGACELLGVVGLAAAFPEICS